MIFFENFTGNYMCNWMDAFNNRSLKETIRVEINSEYV